MSKKGKKFFPYQKRRRRRGDEEESKKQQCAAAAQRARTYLNLFLPHSPVFQHETRPQENKENNKVIIRGHLTVVEKKGRKVQNGLLGKWPPPYGKKVEKGGRVEKGGKKGDGVCWIT
jgi:hypothetical protein